MEDFDRSKYVNFYEMLAFILSDFAAPIKLEPVMHFEQSKLRGFIYQILTNILIYVGIFMYSISLVFGDESVANTSLMFLFIYLGVAIVFAIWIFLFNHSPTLPTYKVSFDDKGVEISKLFSTQKLKWGSINSLEIAKLTARLTLKGQSNNKTAHIGYFAFDKKQRVEIIKQLRKHCRY
jgi:hypothetical protein